MWNEEERQILTVTVGGRVHKLDPLPMHRRYLAGVRKMGQEPFGEALRQLIQGDISPDLARMVLPILYTVMNWPTYEQDAEKGYTEGEVIIGFTQFIEWLVDSKKKAENSLSSAGPDGASAEIPPMPSIANLSSADTSSTHEEPGSTAKEPSLPTPTRPPASTS